MVEFLMNIKTHLEAGGGFFFSIHIVLVLSVAVVIERFFSLFSASVNVEAFLNHIAPSIGRNDLQSAIQFCDSMPRPASRVAKSLLVRALSRGTREDIEAMIEASLARES